MSASTEFLTPSAAARQLGVSPKALRLYERRGLIAPVRTAAGWRTYGPDQMARVAAITFMRSLGLSLAHVERVLDGDLQEFASTLAAHRAALKRRIGQLADAVDKIALLQASHAGLSPRATDPALLPKSSEEPCAAFNLPWPWGSERFELRHIRPINFLTGPLGSGKTRLALRLAEVLPGAAFVGLDRASDGGAATRAQLAAAPLLRERVNQTLTALAEGGAVASDALVALIVGLEAEGPTVLVIDMVEQGLDQATQAALIGHLRLRRAGARPLFLMTRSNVILDLAAVSDEEQIIYCPANHSPPIHVTPYPGGTGYEAVATCLASPEMRGRTEGTVAWRPPAVRQILSGT